MTEAFMNINEVWTPVLIVQTDTVQEYGRTIADGNTRYTVEPLKQEQSGGKYVYWFVVKSKEELVLPEAAQQQITDLQSVNQALGNQLSQATLANATLGRQMGQLTLANSTLGQQVAQLTIKVNGGK
ncbi:MAG: hypothetical protein LKF71_04315 [Oscillospiraceae bacterium]|jgi:hypothetical protein|nr:hypothetical protein [Oscillospiraceae bacterium]